MSTMQYTKMHGLGNDVIVLDIRDQNIDLSKELIAHLCDRRKGVGCDQLMLIEYCSDPEITAAYRIFNPDANEVEQCGNGARCVARYLFEKDALEPEFCLRAMRSDVDVICHSDESVSVSLGVPSFEPDALPLNFGQRLSEYHLEAAGRQLQFGAVSIGNPHAVLSVSSVADTDVEGLGKAIQEHELFPQSTNVEFVEFLARDRLRLRVYERGAGETLACGSGACATVAVGHQWGWLDQQVTVEMPGGEATITWSGEGDKIWLRGDAVFVFTGQLSN
jgi:diaminopimelate epimerase